MRSKIVPSHWRCCKNTLSNCWYVVICPSALPFESTRLLMVCLTCSRCGAIYSEKRFLWENSDESCDVASHRQDHAEGVAGKPAPLLPPAYGDAVRATGTMANVIGSVSAAGQLLAPVSAVCGVVGLASGAVQLKNGLDTPSGETDPHLVAKGGMTAAVGGTCMVLGACAAFVPALCLGAAGVCAAALIDANINGLCEACRSGSLSHSTSAIATSHNIRTTVGPHGNSNRPVPGPEADSSRLGASKVAQRLSPAAANTHEFRNIRDAVRARKSCRQPHRYNSTRSSVVRDEGVVGNHKALAQKETSRSSLEGFL